MGQAVLREVNQMSSDLRDAIERLYKLQTMRLEVQPQEKEARQRVIELMESEGHELIEDEKLDVRVVLLTGKTTVSVRKRDSKHAEDEVGE